MYIFLSKTKFTYIKPTSIITKPTNCSIWGLVTLPMSLDSALWGSAQGNVLPGARGWVRDPWFLWCWNMVNWLFHIKTTEIENLENTCLTYLNKCEAIQMIMKLSYYELLCQLYNIEKLPVSAERTFKTKSIHIYRCITVNRWCLQVKANQTRTCPLSTAMHVQSQL